MNKKQLIVTWVMGILLLSTSLNVAFGNDFFKTNSTYVPMNKPSFKYGRMHIGNDEITWQWGIESKYKVNMEIDDYCIIELLSEPLPRFYDTKCRYIKITFVEPKLNSIGLEFVEKLEDFNHTGNEWFSYALLSDEPPTNKPIEPITMEEAFKN